MGDDFFPIWSSTCKIPSKNSENRTEFLKSLLSYKKDHARQRKDKTQSTTSTKGEFKKNTFLAHHKLNGGPYTHQGMSMHIYSILTVRIYENRKAADQKLF